MHSPAAFAHATAAPARSTRRVILGTAFLIGLAFAMVPRTGPVHAQESKGAPAAASTPAASSKPPTTVEIRIGDAKVEAGTVVPAGDAPSTDGKSPVSGGSSQAADKPPGKRGVVVGKHGRVQIDGLVDREFDSVGDLVHNEPEIAGMVVAVVSVVFLSPVLVIALILWYRMRKARMLNETMLMLAEKGVVTSGDALEALAGGKQEAMLRTAAATAPFNEQAKQIRRRAAWSDLRKGVFTGGVGLALMLYSLLEDGAPNGLGLVLFFVGAGFIVLWWFEERQLAPATGLPPATEPSMRASGTPPGGAPPSA